MKASHANSSGHQRAGFTLVELLVVIAIIGVLIAILLPAVQRVRESARRAACSNNGKQCGLAIQNFLSTHGRFPRVGANETDKIGKNWLLAILPYLEENQRYDAFQGGATQANSLDKGAIPTIACASSAWAASTLGYSGKPVSNWGAVMGDVGVYVHNQTYTSNSGILNSSSGGAVITRDSVKDGLSNTAVLGEIAIHDKNTKKFLASWFYRGNGISTVNTRKECFDAAPGNDNQGHGLSPFDILSTMVSMAWIPNTKACQRSGESVPGSNRGTSVASWHPGGVHVVMADGAVKFVSEDVDCGGDVNGDPWKVLYNRDTSSTNRRGPWGAIATRASGESERLP